MSPYSDFCRDPTPKNLKEPKMTDDLNDYVKSEIGKLENKKE